MAEQLSLLVEFGRRGNVDLRIMPLSQRQSTYVQHPFMVFGFEGASAEQALIETTVQDYRLSDPASVDKLSHYFEQLSSSALSRDASLAFIREVASDLTGDH
jgi:hypothetical protein